jgi:hypothetical protein
LLYLRYIAAELRRRPGRTALTALGLAIGVGLVIEGEVPEPGTVVNPHAGGYDISSLSVTGVDIDKPSLAPVTSGQVREGEYFSRSPQKARGETIVDIGYARQNGIVVGEKTKVAGKRFEVVGLSAAPLGGGASNLYLELGRLQQLSDRKGRANVLSSCGSDDDEKTPPSAPRQLPPEFLECMADQGFDVSSPDEIHSAPPQVLQGCLESLHQGDGAP